MSRPRRTIGDQPGRLVATMLRALAAELSDPGRYSRAKAYARDGAVIEIDTRPEIVSGLVLGSRRDPYEVLLVADPAPADEIDRADPAALGSMTMLIPGRDELSVSCTCPDAGGSPGVLCKHAVAVLLVLADETSIEPGLLDPLAHSVRQSRRPWIPRHPPPPTGAGPRRVAGTSRPPRRHARFPGISSPATGDRAAGGTPTTDSGPRPGGTPGVRPLGRRGRHDVGIALTACRPARGRRPCPDLRT